MATNSFLQWKKSSFSMENNSITAGGVVVEEKEKKQRGKRSSSGKVSQKKQPQRGLGVAQLERLRLQERWKKMTTEFDHVQAAHNLQFQLPRSASAPLARPCGPLISYQSGFGIFNSQKLGNQFMAEKELSSTQTSIHCLSDHRDICFEKKRSHNVGFDGGNIARGCDFLGLSLGRKRPIEDVEVVAIHRKGNNIGSVLMEYEFFPAARKGSSNRDYSSKSMSVVAEGTEGSVSEASTTNTEWLDLSLRLSC